MRDIGGCRSASNSKREDVDRGRVEHASAGQVEL
jgi:hypothetical protein